jgi:predicted RNase H-like nuclease (RuvC/YqgF family)
MTRGKHGAAAARRREDAEVQAEIAAYQRNVKRLTDENRQLSRDLAEERAQHALDVRTLSAQLDEGLSPELSALRQKLAGEEERARQRIRAVGLRLIQLWWANDITMTAAAWVETQQLLGVSGEQLTGKQTRRSRRTTPQKMKAAEDSWRQAQGSGPVI